MKEKFNKFIHGRLFIAVLLVIFASISLLVGTYAWFTWSSTNNTKLVLSIGSMADVTFSSGNEINSGLTPVFNYSDGISTNFSINNRDKSGVIISYNINLNITTIDNELISEDVKWTLVKNGKVIKEGNLLGASNNSTVSLYNGALSTGSNLYEFYLYIDGNVENDPNMIGKTIVGNIMVEAQEGTVNLLNHINNLYIENYDSSKDITFADGTGMNYYAPEVSLMNDGLDSAGAMTNDPYTGNIRYYGSDDENLNNYIYFNCSDYSDTSTCEVWRIIGIVDGKVKIMKNEYIGNYAYDDSSNNWNESSIKELLNSGTYFTSIQNKNDKTVDLISESTWYTNEINNVTYSNILYKEERTGNNVSLEKIALVYPSDYGYATDLNICTNTLYNYNSELCTSVNWMKTVFSVEYYYWLITPKNGYYVGAYGISNTGKIEGFDTVADPYAVIPTLYLDPELTINKGNGSSGNPYQIYIEPEPTPFSDFTYYLGSETSTITSLSNQGYNEDLSLETLNADITLSEDEILLVDYNGSSSDVYIPDTYTISGTTYKVTLLSSLEYYSNDYNSYYTGVFQSNDTISIVKFDENVRILYAYYSDCSDFGIGGSTSYGDANRLFWNCTNLIDVITLPTTITSMGSTFTDCTGLVNAPEIPDSVTTMRSTFSGCTSLVNAPVIPSSVTELQYSFQGCTKLTEVPEIPNSVTNMYGTFSGCTSLVNAPEIPNSVTNLSWSFQNCTSLTSSPVIPDSVTNLTGTFYGCTSLIVAPEIPSSVTTLSSTFGGCTGLTEAPEIPSSVTTLSSTFEGCTGLTEAPEIPNSVTNMNVTFRGCTSLTEAPEIPNSVTNMAGTFKDCTSLINAPVIPASVTELQNSFNGCTSLTGTVRIESSNVRFFTNIFSNTSKSITVEVPAGSTTYTNISALTTTNGMPSNVTLSTFTAN